MNRGDKIKKEKAQQEKLRELIRTSNLIRDKDRDFHGLEREFMLLQDKLLSEFGTGGHVHHPRDRGNIREDTLRDFIRNLGYFPKKISISETSTRVISPTGHSSKELDLILFDSDEAITLMRRGASYEAYPVECVYGAIQVKSNLNKLEIGRALDNIASFKSLAPGRSDSGNGFGVIFAYTSDLDWSEIIEEIKSHQQGISPSLWANLVVILDRGIIFNGDDSRGYLHNSDISQIKNLQMHGRHDSGDSLFSLFTNLLDLCNEAKVKPVPVNMYYRLPLIAGPHSYRFWIHQFELDDCPKHGKYPKKLTEETIKRLISAVSKSEEVDLIAFISEADGSPPPPAGNPKQMVAVYNPEGLPPAEIIATPGQLGVQFEMVYLEENPIVLPKYYLEREGIIEPCLKCVQEAAKKKAKKTNAAKKGARKKSVKSK